MTIIRPQGDFGTEGVDDVDFDTVFDDLRAELALEPEVENIPFVVPRRPNFQIVFRPVVDFDQLKLWRKRSKEGKKADSELNEKRFMILVLAETCVGIQKKRDNKWIDIPLTFKSRELQDMLGVVMGGYAAAIEKMYGSDGHIIMVGQAILEAAGYADYDYEGESDPLGG